MDLRLLRGNGMGADRQADGEVMQPQSSHAMQEITAQHRVTVLPRAAEGPSGTRRLP
jgi:hypothetical protein